MFGAAGFCHLVSEEEGIGEEALREGELEEEKAEQTGELGYML